MIDSGATYLPQDRRIALARGEELPERIAGAAMLADISGFTPLTEALAQSLGPRRGIEEMTAQVNRIYDALIGAVERFGGSVVGFAGDAMVCWFDGEDAPLRAVGCALALQGAMGAFAALPLPQGGTVAIGLKVAVASGPARRFTVGEPATQRIDTLAGATIARTGAGEHLAQRGEVLVDEPTADRLEGVLRVGEWREDGAERYGVVESLLAAAPEAPIPAGSAPDEARSRAWLLPAVYDRLLDGLGEFLTELRPAVALFISFEGIDYDGDPAAGEQLDRLVRAAQATIGRYGGTLLQLTIGDKGSYCYAAFGAPVSYEDNARRAVAAALELRGLPAELRFLRPLRIGLSAGVMRSGAYGGTTRRTYGVLGDEVNLAARLMTQAAPGEVLASGRVRDQAGAAFAWEALPAVRVKGKREPVALARLLGAQAPLGDARSALGSPGDGAPLVGREAELARLVALARPIFAGRFAGVVAVVGEPGMGKSRLVAELRRRLGSPSRGRGARRGPGEVSWLSMPADEILRQSLNPFRTFLRAYLDQRPDASAEENAAASDAAVDRLIAAIQGVGGRRRAVRAALAAELERTRSFLAALVDVRRPGTLYEQLDPKLRFENTLAALRALVLAESLRRPTVLHLEDAQWLDEDSRQVVRLIARDAAALPLLLLVTSRTRDDGAPVELPVDDGLPAQTITLGALAPEGVRLVGEGVLGAPVGDDLAAFLAAKTGGNPFFAEQLALDLRERGLLAERPAADGAALELGDPAAVEVPDTISAVLIARLDRLAARVKAVVQTAAVLGQEFEVRLLAGMLRDDAALPERVREAERETIWTALSELRYLFRHALLRDAAYDMQLRSRLRELHRLAAETIERVHAADLAPSAADLTYHYGRAEDAPQERRYARVAGDYAAARYAGRDAAGFYGRALELTPAADGPGRYALLLAREQVYDIQGARDAQRGDLAALAALADDLDDPARRALAALREANYAEVTGDYDAAVDLARRAIDLAESAGDAAAAAMGAFRWGRALVLRADYADAPPHLERALELARAAGLPGLEADSLRNLGLVAMHHQGDHAAAREYGRRAIALFQAAGDRRGESMAVNNLGAAAYYEGDIAAAAVHIAGALELSAAIGDRLGEAEALVNLGALTRERGAYAEAREYGERALAICRSIGDPWGESGALNLLSNCALNQGDYPAARRYQEQALSVCRAAGERLGESIALTSLGAIHTLFGDFAAARAAFDAALAVLREIGNRQAEGWSLGYFALLLHIEGDQAAAISLAEQALVIAAEIGAAHSDEAKALSVLGHAAAALGRDADAEAAYRRALTICEAAGEPLHALDAVAGLARLALAAGDPPGALAHAEAILVHTEALAFETIFEPLRVRLTAYQALSAAVDSRAPGVLAEAYRILSERAARLDSPVRRAFLENVPAHRDLAAAWSAQAGAT